MIINKRKNKLIALFILLFIPIILITTLFIYTFFLPEKISVKAGQASTIDYFLPFQAEIVPESVNVLNVNNQPVDNNIKLSFSKPATFIADTDGKWNMTLSLYGIPLKNVSVHAISNEALVPGGEIVGIRVNTNGVLVLGTGDVKDLNGKYTDPSQGKIKTGDLIKYVNNKPVSTKEELIKAVETCEASLNMIILRNNDKLNVSITPTVSIEDNKKKIGLWVRDSTQGIGTITYYDKVNNSFGALGHPITDIDTGQLMKISTGNIYNASIDKIIKGAKGAPGQITGKISADNTLGTIIDNNKCGIYGKANTVPEKKEYPIALKNQVKTDKAVILSSIEGELKEYNIEISAINTFNKNDSKSMIIKITDNRLLTKTGGIIQGMSGSPIIQNGKIVGAVTHVFINDPSRGYGIFIENMLEH